MTVLIACVGNIWLGDDGFGPAVAKHLSSVALPAGVELRDFGIRTMDLRYALERSEAAILVDVMRGSGAPGTIYVIDPVVSHDAGDPASSHHGATSTEVIQWAARRRTRGELPRFIRLVACEPESFGEDGEGRLGLSLTLELAVVRAADAVLEVIRNLRGEAACTSSA